MAFAPSTGPVYNIPWTVTDSVLTWLEPTKECNMNCPGCFSPNSPGQHKPLPAVLSEIDAIRAGVRTDVVGIAGGEPLCYPQLREVVRYVKRSGFHPFLMTNGAALTPASLALLKADGLSGVCFHIDSMQKRDGWTGKTELELNKLRRHYAEMVRAEGGLSCYLSMTVNRSNLASAGDVYEWTRRNAPLVELISFIAFKIPENFTAVQREAIGHSEVKADEILAALAAKDNSFKPCASLKSPFSGIVKWSVAAAFTGREGRAVTPAFFAAAQELSRRWRGRYLGRLRGLSFLETAAAALLLFFKRGVTFGDLRALFGGVQVITIVQPETIIRGEKPRFFM